MTNQPTKDLFGGATKNALAFFYPPTGAYRIFRFQLFLVWQPSKLPEPMKNEQTLGYRRFSHKEPHLPLSRRLTRRAKCFRYLGMFEKIIIYNTFSACCLPFPPD